MHVILNHTGSKSHAGNSYLDVHNLVGREAVGLVEVEDVIAVVVVWIGVGVLEAINTPD